MLRRVALPGVAVVALVASVTVSPASAQSEESAPPPAPSTTVDPLDEWSNDPEVTGIATTPPDDPAAAVRAASSYVFGAGPLESVENAATAAAATATCSASERGIVAMVLAPTFYETGAYGAAAPSPMTLSRWDINNGLHSLADPDVYPRAFWHPGVGPWQFDSAGGWGLTAAERIDTDIISAVAVDVMVKRFCNARNAGGEPDEWLASAWRPWYACRNRGGGRGYCHDAFDTLFAGTGDRVNVTLDESVATTGGMIATTCTLPGVGTVDCHRVDPSLAQGHAGPGTWSSPSVRAGAPISHAFSVASAGGYEWRLWAKEDTGYAVDIAGRRPLGVNPRLKTNPDRRCERTTAITWYLDGVPQDVADRSRCYPEGESYEVVPMNVNGTYRPFVADFTGDGRDEIFWYGPGATPDYVFVGPAGADAALGLNVRGEYEPLVGDFDGDGHDDVFWYGVGHTPDYVFTGNDWAPADGGLPFDTDATLYRVQGVYDPVVGDFDGNGIDDVLWNQPGDDWLFLGTPSLEFEVSVVSLIEGEFVVGDTDEDGFDDIFVHGGGNLPDREYWGSAQAPLTAVTAHGVGGTYTGLPGDFDGDGATDIVFDSVAAGAQDWILWGGARSAATTGERWQRIDLDDGVRLFAVPFDGTDLLYAYGPGSIPDSRYSFGYARNQNASDEPYALGSEYVTLPGRFSAAGTGVLFYQAGGTPDAIWIR